MFHTLVHLLCGVFAAPLSILLSPDAIFDSLKPFNFCTIKTVLTFILLMWRIWRAPNIASRWQMGFNLAFKGLRNRQSCSLVSSKLTISKIIGKAKGKGYPCTGTEALHTPYGP